MGRDVRGARITAGPCAGEMSRSWARRSTTSLLLACILIAGGCSSGSTDSDGSAAEGTSAPSGDASPRKNPSPGTASPRPGPGASMSPSSSPESEEVATGSTSPPAASTSETSEETSEETEGATGGTEVSDAEAQAPVEGGLPGLSPAPAGALVTPPLPRSQAMRGRLVRGYPVRLLPMVPGSDVVASGVTSQSSRLQVTLTATTSKPVDRVLLHHRVRLGRLGFVEDEAASPGQTTFTRDRDSVAVSVTRAGTTTSYALLATLHAG